MSGQKRDVALCRHPGVTGQLCISNGLQFVVMGPAVRSIPTFFWIYSRREDDRRTCLRGTSLELEMALHEFAKFFAVFVAHVDEFHAAAVRADIPDNRGEVDLAQAGTNLQLDGIAHTEFLRGFQVGAS